MYNFLNSGYKTVGHFNYFKFQMGGQAARKMKLGFGAATGFTILVLALIGGVVGWIHTRDKIEHKVGTGPV